MLNEVFDLTSLFFFSELEHVFAFRKRRRLPRASAEQSETLTYFGEEDLPIAAVKLDGPALTVNLEVSHFRSPLACTLCVPGRFFGTFVFRIIYYYTKSVASWLAPWTRKVRPA